MGICSTEAVILKTYSLGDADKIAVAYTRRYGKVRGVAQGARRLKSQFAGRLEPFNWVELIFFEKENQELVKIDKVELLRPFGAGIVDYRGLLQLSFLAEVLFETTPEREPNDPLFRLLLLVLEEMQIQERSELARLYFQVWHLKISGLFPASKFCTQCKLPLLEVSQVYYLPDQQSFCCPSCKGSTSQILTARSFLLLDQILKKTLRMIDWDFGSEGKYKDLQQCVDGMVQRNFDCSFQSLALMREELNLN
jgi:DNA repair protein RecO (recombination protein O)